jgi:hypothetical protein
MQGWGKEPMCCKTCAHCITTKNPKTGMHGFQYSTRSQKCGVGGFAVKQMNSCHEWSLKPTE